MRLSDTTPKASCRSYTSAFVLHLISDRDQLITDSYGWRGAIQVNVDHIIRRQYSFIWQVNAASHFEHFFIIMILQTTKQKAVSMYDTAFCLDQYFDFLLMCLIELTIITLPSIS